MAHSRSLMEAWQVLLEIDVSDGGKQLNSSSVVKKEAHRLHSLCIRICLR